MTVKCKISIPKNFFIFSVIFLSASGVNSLTCYKSDIFDPNDPGENVEDCEKTEVCVRYIGVKDNITITDKIECGLIEQCSENGEVLKANDSSIAVSCFECNTDKCIPIAHTAEDRNLTEVSSTEEKMQESITTTEIPQSINNKSTTIGIKTTTDDEDDQDDPDDALYRKQPIKRNDNDQFNGAVGFYAMVLNFPSYLMVVAFSLALIAAEKYGLLV